ncbi:unnamed protein product [Auanema sp. JU1783]|nr:unnamed protein product [Auanema sp. JU1783]
MKYLLSLLLLCLIESVYGQTVNPNLANPNLQLLQQCNCIANPSGTGCLSYDSRFQAATLEEAMASFPDLTFSDPMNSSDNETLEERATCQTEECLRCHEELLQQLKTIGLVDSTINNVFSTQPDLLSTSMCNKYHFSRKDEGTYSESKKSKEESSSSEEDGDKKKKKREKEKEKEKAKRSKEQKRSRRQATFNAVNDPTVVGQRFTISCSAKGVSTDASGLVSLCSSCWAWRKLPDNYTPQFINELVCDNADNACLSGYASCGVGHRSVEVVRDDNGVKTTIVLTAGSYCECKVAHGSVLESLVSGTGLQSPLPAQATSSANVV